MSAIRVLHVDDEADIREVIDISLGLDPDFAVRACASGAEAAAAAAAWSPFIILLDVMMPGMDGPATLVQLRRHPQSADIPILFMTARTQMREVEHLIALGAQGVISKPFDPMTLALLVRSHLQAVRIDTLRGIFMRRTRSDAAVLKPYRSRLAEDHDAGALGPVRQIAHGLAGAAGLLGFNEIGNAADAVEEAATATRDGGKTQTDLADLSRALDNLIVRLENEWHEPSAAVA